ncbi:hypothetical protein INT48_007184 [Thamnidium elegans]|uniref:Uncharacterized protein n=1 Tax=Thamnidium elegans TaxID=101142 RepID=A0A8H7SU38_9FUNG|nr:hypothetical protein INT48_007184 [Thamnidium elegans]
MKGDKEKQPVALYTDQDTPPVASNRWMWVRRFILCIILITLFMQSLAPIYLDSDEDIFIANEVMLTETKKSHIVLHTGFPPTENVSGLTIYAGKAAATAFSPNPDSPNVKQIDMKHAFVDGGESWWDRWFPNRHVHLVSVQLPVVPVVKNGTGIVEATLSICASKKQRFGIGRPQVPDMNKCVETAALKSDAEESDDLFSVLEWLPEVTIVLQKSKLYWLVVQTPSEPFNWVNSEGGSNQYGTAFETENGWEFKLDGELIPSAMVMVEDHHKD